MQHYTITYEQLTPQHTRAQTVTKAKSPYILENLGIMILIVLGRQMSVFFRRVSLEYFIMCTNNFQPDLRSNLPPS